MFRQPYGTSVLSHPKAGIESRAPGCATNQILVGTARGRQRLRMGSEGPGEKSLPRCGFPAHDSDLSMLRIYILILVSWDDYCQYMEKMEK